MLDENKKWFLNKLRDLIKNSYKTIKLSSTKRHILLVIAGYANKNGYAFPSYQTIANETGFSKPCVKKNVLGMENDFILSLTERYKISGDRDSNGIQIHLNKIVYNYEEVDIVDTHVDIVDTQGWVTSIQEVGNVVTPNKLLELPNRTTQENVDYFLEETEETKAVEDFVNNIYGDDLFGEH